MEETPRQKVETLLQLPADSPGQPTSQFWSRPDGKLHVQWYRADKLVAFEPHTHSEFNVVVSLEGAVETRQLGEAVTVEAGEAMMGSNPGVEHASWYRPGARGSEAVSLTFSPGFLEELMTRNAMRRHAPPGGAAYRGKIQSALIAKAASEIVAEMKARAFAHETIIEGLATRVLVESLRLWPRERVIEVEEDRTPRLSRRDHIRAFEFMRWCKKDAFRIQHLCRFLGTSEERFNRLFRAATKDSPASFYNRLLLEQAGEMLAEPGYSVKEIGYELGFKTPSHFVVAFRRHFGRTPQDYRQTKAALGRE